MSHKLIFTFQSLSQPSWETHAIPFSCTGTLWGYRGGFPNQRVHLLIKAGLLYSFHIFSFLFFFVYGRCLLHDTGCRVAKRKVLPHCVSVPFSCDWLSKTSRKSCYRYSCPDLFSCISFPFQCDNKLETATWYSIVIPKDLVYGFRLLLYFFWMMNQ